jgi:hypothetical protein
VDTEHGLVEGAKYTAKEGDHVVVHYSEDAGHKVVHFSTHLTPGIVPVERKPVEVRAESRRSSLRKRIHQPAQRNPH